MVTPDIIGEFLYENGYGPYTGVPCSILSPLINYTIDHPKIKFYMATSEGEAMGIAAGFTLGGRIPVVLMQNSGLGNCINPITSLHLIYKLKVLLLITLRGETGVPDEPQHQVMGRITFDLLKCMGIPYEIMNDEREKLIKQLVSIDKKIKKRSLPSALVIRKGTISSYNIKGFSQGSPKYYLSRKKAIKLITSNLSGKEAIISTTGKISRELFYDNKNRKGNFYMVGSMGCASAIAFGLAKEKPERKILVLDGDGSFLMKMGNIATIGFYSPANLIHIILDNEAHDSTGGQHTVSGHINLGEIASNCGFKSSRAALTDLELTKALKRALNEEGPHSIHVKVRRGSDKNLGRPALTPDEIKDRFSAFLETKP
jgi:phosphonopyruvate decarboxylase|tara:strand:- start:772 stop:1887 length:1116 start_codon:yes stop_codon:yes gene_type:complete